MVLRRPRISTTCQVHERRRVLVRFYRSNQPWGKGGLGVPHVSQTRLIPITKHQTHCSSLLHSLPIFKTHRYRIFFSFLELLGNKPFSSHRHTTQLAVWAFCTAFPLFFVRIANLCVVRTRRVGSYKYRSKMQAIIMFRIRAAQQGSNTYRNLPV
jgi:hypothetical protein